MSARHEAELDDGRRLLLLDDRGWTEAPRGAGANEIDDLWALTSERDIAETARVVVGPDEPFNRRSQGDMETHHWNALAETLVRSVSSDASELRHLPTMLCSAPGYVRASVAAPATRPERPPEWPSPWFGA